MGSLQACTCLSSSFYPRAPSVVDQSDLVQIFILVNLKIKILSYLLKTSIKCKRFNCYYLLHIMQYIGHLHGKTQREKCRLIRVYSIFLRIVKIALSNENKISKKTNILSTEHLF